MICRSGASKSRIAKAAGAEPSDQLRDEKLHAVVARSKFPSQNVQSTPCAGHFWKLTCRKSARRCGTKHISKSKCTKNTMLGAPLEVDMLKKCTLLWREAHFQVKMCKTHHARNTFGSWHVEKVHAVAVRSTFASHTMFGALLEVDMLKKCTPLWREAHFQVKSVKNWRDQSTLERSDVILGGRRKGFCKLSKVSKTWRFCSSFKSAGRGGTFEEDLQRCFLRGRCSTRDMFIRDVWRSGRWFPERG